MKKYTTEKIDKTSDTDGNLMKRVHLADIKEIERSAKKTGHGIFNIQIEVLKDAFYAYEYSDWEKCKEHLILFFLYWSLDEEEWKLNSVGWNLDHLFRWKKMLEMTELDEEPKCLEAYVFYNMVKEEILNRIPLHVRCAWEILLDDLSPDLIRFIQNSAGETENSEKWIGINKLLSTFNEFEAFGYGPQRQTLQ